MSKENSLNVVKIGKGATINFAGTVSNGLLVILTVWIIARLFDAESLGIYFLGMSVFQLTNFPLATGLRQGVVRYVALLLDKSKEDLNYGTISSALKIAMVSSLLIAVTLYVLAPFLAHIFSEAGLSDFLRILVLATPLFAISTVFLAATRGAQNMEYTVYVRKIVEPGLQLILLVVFFFLGWHLSGLALSVLISLAIGAFLSFYFFKRIFSFYNWRLSYPSNINQILSFSFPLAVSATLSSVILKMDIFALGYFDSATNVGVYSAIIQVAIWISAVQASLNAMVAPVISHFSGQQNFTALGKLLKMITRWTFTICFPIFLLVVFFRVEILQSFGPSFAIGTTSLIFVSLGQLILAGSGPTEFMVVMSGYPKIHLINNILLFGASIFLNATLVPKYGILGASIANLSLMTLLNLAWLLETYLLLKIHPFCTNLLKPLTAGSVALLLIWSIQYLFFFNNTLLSIGSLFFLFFAAYFILLLKLGLEIEEQQILFVIKGKIVSNFSRYRIFADFFDNCL